NRMARQLVDLVFPNLQIDEPRDNRGILVIGNYGTGKSHLMSVLAAVAQHEELAELIENEQVRQAAQSVAGRFKVVRVEIGGVQKGLRELLLDELEEALAQWGIDYNFPPSDTISNNKDALVEAMGLFQEAFPNHGLLLVVDELLDYLRTRTERALILDLGFLRELGEVVALT